MSNRLKWALGIGGLVLAAGIYHYFFPGYCRAAKGKYGLTLRSCPEGQVKQLARIQAIGLSRKQAGTVEVSARALYTVSKADEEQSASLTSFKVKLALIAPDGTETKLEPEATSEKDRAKGKKGKWRNTGSARVARISLPEVADGDYKLRADVKSKVGETTVEVPLALYAPAKIHVLTDRPLYEPGNVVKFRALALRANDLTPIDRRPGKWIVSDPTGQVLLEEKVSAVDWGIASGTFPIDAGARSGVWTVEWSSGADSGSKSFTVEPFTLPRFNIEAKTAAPFYGRRQRPVLEGAIKYASGAPVIGARVDVTWSSQGTWPPPREWLTNELPKTIEVGSNGRFSVTLPEVPADLREQATLIAQLSAVDPAGDRVVGSARVLLSEDPIRVEALTELADGLVQGANNRLYLRVATADGRPLAGTPITVKRGWEPTDKGIETTLDEDGVGRLQVDPGQPVNVVVPPMPIRPPVSNSGPLVTRTGATDLVSQTSASLSDRRAMDLWTPKLEGCAKWSTGGGSDNAAVGLRVSPSGQITGTATTARNIDRCVASVIEAERLPAGQARLYRVSFSFRDPQTAVLVATSTSTLGAVAAVEQLVASAATDARQCVGPSSPDSFGDGLSWQIRADQSQLAINWIRVSSAPPMQAATKRCIAAAFSRHSLETPAAVSDLGVVRFSVRHPARKNIPVAQPTIMKGYELRVSAKLADDSIGSTTVRLTPGVIPRIRMRTDRVVASPGQTIKVSVLRGPDFDGKLPKKIRVRHLDKSKFVDLDKKTREADYKLPDDADGWYVFDGVEGATARVYVHSKAGLEVDVAAEKPQYQPGQKARLNIKTKLGGQGAAAAVGLFGVDASLAQLTPLPGADALGGLRPPIEMSAGKAFGVLDAQALTVGRIRGANAAEATVLRVSRVPAPADLDRPVSASAETPFDPVAVLTDRFYPILAEMHRQAREWERSAPEGEEMNNDKLAKLWKKALEQVKKRGGEVTDAYGRELRLHRLPSDLLALTEPQQVVFVGTRLPEDFENWTQWVQKEKP